jgi:hypothetical protein
MSEDIRTLVRNLAVARAKGQEIESEMQRIYNEEVIPSPAYQKWFAYSAPRHEAEQALEKAEAALRTAIIEDAQATGQRQYPDDDPAAEVKEYKGLYYEEAQLLAWAEQNAPVLILKSLDKATVKKVAVALGAPVEEVVELRPFVQKDLSRFLE